MSGDLRMSARPPANEVLERLHVSPEAQRVALVIDGVIEEIFVAHGMTRSAESRKAVVPIAKLVQLAINLAMERVDA